MKKEHLVEFAKSMDIDHKGNKSDIIKRIFQDGDISNDNINRFIKSKYNDLINERRDIITDDELKQELNKVKIFNWGVVQGQLDSKIQREYVRKYVKYKDLIENIKSILHSDITSYVICSWFNHWTTVLIEEHISNHKNVIPTLKNVGGIDLFFREQPFDLKITYIPGEYSSEEAINNPKDLAIWLYENQGAQRFGDDNRIFVVLFDKENPENSWKLKRDFNLIYKTLDYFFDNEKVSSDDEIIFTFGNRTYTAITKIVLITN